MSRKRFTERQVLSTLIIQGIRLFCYRCKQPMECSNEIEREHLLELALGGEDAPRNCVYSCRVCHKRVTGGSKATSAGSSKNRIAKDRRRRGLTKPKIKRTWPKRKVPSRKFR